MNRCAHALALVAGVAAAAAGGGMGCTSRQHNEWYFAAAEIPAPPDTSIGPDGKPAADAGTLPKVKLKFYRVRVDGTSYGGHAKLLTGLYPADPLHELFGEVAVPAGFPAVTPREDDAHGDHEDKPETPGSGDTGDAAAANADGDESGTNPVAEKLRKALELACNREFGELNLINSDMRFTVFYGMNADAMADQVKAFAKAESTGNGLARLLLAAGGAGEAKLAADDAKAAADALVKGAGETATALRTQATAIATTQPAAPVGSKVTEAAVTAAQAALTALGSDLKLDPADADWPAKAKAAAKAMRDKEGK